MATRKKTSRKKKGGTGTGRTGARKRLKHKKKTA